MARSLLCHGVTETANMNNTNLNETNGSKKGLRGFAAMSPEKQKEIARKGGKAAHERGTAHEFTPDEARVAGRKGGEVVSRDRDHMATIGREGGRSHRRNRDETPEPARLGGDMIVAGRTGGQTF